MQEPSMTVEDDERLAQLMGPSRALLARVEIHTLSSQRAASVCLLGAVFCVCAAAGMGVLVPFAPMEHWVVIIAAATVFAVAAGLLLYGMNMKRLDLAPLQAFGIELRAGLRNAELAYFDRPEDEA